MSNSDKIRGTRDQTHQFTVAGRTRAGRGSYHPVTFRELASALMPFLVPAKPGSSTSSANQTAPVLHGFGFNIGGLMLGNELIGGGTFSRNMRFDTTDAYAIVSETPAAASATFHLVTGAPVETTVGTIVFAAASSVGVLTWTSPPFNLTAGTRIKLRAPPNPADTTLAFVSGLIDGRIIQ